MLLHLGGHLDELLPAVLIMPLMSFFLSLVLLALIVAAFFFLVGTFRMLSPTRY